MERMQSAQYFHARQACYTCLNPNDVVDTGIQIEGEGELAICRSCIADLARTAGFDLDDRSKDIRKLEMQVTRLQGDVKYLTAFKDSVIAGIPEKV